GDTIDSLTYILCLEGGGTRCQAALLESTGTPLHISESTDVNTNFISLEAAKAAVLRAVSEVLRISDIPGKQVSRFVSALVGPRFGPEVFSGLIPNATYQYYTERDVVFARAGIYEPHGVAIVAATGASAWGMRRDDDRIAMMGGWGTLLGDEGSAYAVGLMALRAAPRIYEKRITTPTKLLETLYQRFDMTPETFRPKMYDLAYHNPISRAEIAGLAVLVSRLAGEGDLCALRIMEKAANDLANLALHAARAIFLPHETFVVAAAGGLLNAGELILAPLQQKLADEFPHARLIVGKEEPAVALGLFALYNNFILKNDKDTGC
ncbi:MAG: BadF/BadG/BcrA/BcrD ATPase family protein, partial [Anaerolineae bacterium]|nr:BadF/BadG/BcrA/BcrD ATPase family protein [Anaerolineae bacterium]